MISRPSDLLAEVIETFAISRDAIKIAARVIRSDQGAFVRDTAFVGLSRDESLRELAAMRARVEQLAILNLWTIFERFVIDHVAISARTSSDGFGSPFLANLSAKLEREIERWRFEEIIDLFRGMVEADQLGHVKQIRDYRNWIAHRNAKKFQPAVVDPMTARTILGFVMDRIS